jgi:hypothetical protein
VNGLLALLGPFRDVAVAVAGGALVFVAVGVYDKLIDDPAVAEKARAEYVVLAEKTAAAAKAEEVERQRIAGAMALAESERRRAALAFQQRIEAEAREREILEHESKMQVSARACLLDDADVNLLLRKPESAAGKRGK